MVHLPAPTAWPLTMAFGVTLILMGLVTHWAISALGVLLFVASVVGWFRNVLPHEKHEMVAVVTEVVEISSTATGVERLPISARHRKILPIERYTFGAGVQGGIAGGIVMLAPATLYGYLAHHSIWYAPNILAAIAIPHWSTKSVAFLSAFHFEGLVVALGVHALVSVLVGLLYGAILPMFPFKPILTAGFLAPIFWTALVYAVFSAVAPGMNARIDWLWFVASQIAFGLVAGFIVNLHVRVRTHQYQSLPFSVRAGLEMPPEDLKSGGQGE